MSFPGHQSAATKVSKGQKWLNAPFRNRNVVLGSRALTITCWKYSAVTDRMVNRWMTDCSVSLPVYSVMFKPVKTPENHRSKALCILKYLHILQYFIIDKISIKILLHVCTTVSKWEKAKAFYLKQLLYTSAAVRSWLLQTFDIHDFLPWLEFCLYCL